MHMLATAVQMKELDRVAIEERGIPSLELMENAAAAVAEQVQRQLGDRRHFSKGARSLIFSMKDGRTPTPEEEKEIKQLRAIVEDQSGIRVAAFCGPGNNGGDGIAAARLLMACGHEVRAFLVGDRDKMTPDARTMEQKLKEAGGKLETYRPDDQAQNIWLTTCSCMIDALFGVGLARTVKGDFLQAIRRMNHVHCPVVACDVPSGVNADTGEIMGEAVKASATVTFSCAKPGLYLGEGGPCAGEIKVADIGIPFELMRELHSRVKNTEVLPRHAHLVLPRRNPTAHKGDFGKVFILAGSEGYTGAPVLASRAAVRTGAGLVYLGVPRDVYPIVAVKSDEAMPFPLPEDYQTILNKAKGCDVALIGPGLGRAPHTEELVRSLLRDLDIPIVLDADGINALQGHIDILDSRKGLTVLTPHDGEFQRLSGCALPIQDRLGTARDFAAAHHCVLVLKGHGTVTAAPDGSAFINTTGNPGMAKGGSGDVLAGMIASLLGQKQFHGPHVNPAELAAWAVFYHGQAGDLCAEKLGEYSMTPSDMIEALPQVLREHEQRD